MPTLAVNKSTYHVFAAKEPLRRYQTPNTIATGMSNTTQRRTLIDSHRGAIEDRWLPAIPL